MKKQLLAAIAFCTLLNQMSLAQCNNFPKIISNKSDTSCGPLSATWRVPSDEIIQSTAFNVPATGTFAGGRTEPFTFTIGCKGYVGAGAGYNTSLNLDKTLNDFWEFDPTTETWSQKANFPVARRGAIGFSIGNFGYAGGGANSSGNYQTGFYRYDPTTNTWLNRANIPVARWLASGASDGTFGYMLGGYEDQNLDANDGFYQYNPTSNTWTSKAAFGGGVRAEATMMAINGTIYAGMGYATSYDNNNNPSSSFIKDDFWAYNSVADTWSQKVNCPTKSKGAIAFGIGNKGYVYGGYGLNTFDFREYNPTNNTWTQRTNLSASIYKGGSFVIGNVAYFGLGVSTPSDDAYSGKSDWRKYYPSNTSVTWSTGSTADTTAISTSSNATYTVSVTSITGLTGTGSDSVIVSNGPTISISGTTICPGVSYTLTPTGATNYTYSPAGPVINPTATTTYTITGQDSYGCTGSTTVTINVTPLGAPTVGSISVCNGATVADLTATGLPGSSIVWYAAATGGSPLAGTTPLAPATTYYAAQSLNGCESASRAAATPTIQPVTPAPYKYKVNVGLTFTGPFMPPSCFTTHIGIHIEDGIENGKRRFTKGAFVFGNPVTSTVKYTGTNWIITDGTTTYFSSSAVGVNDLPPTTGWSGASCSQTTFNTLTIDSLNTNRCVGSELSEITGIGGGIKWYDAATAGNLLPNTTAIVSGTHYYATQTVNGCESPTRLDFVPTIINATQSITSTQGVNSCGPLSNDTILVATATGGTITWWTTNAPGTNNPFYQFSTNDTVKLFGPFNSTQTRYVSTFDGTCYSSPRVPVSLTITNTPAVGASSVDYVLTGNCAGSQTFTFDSIINGKNRYILTQGSVTSFIKFDGTKWVLGNNLGPANFTENTTVPAGVLPPATGWVILNPSCSGGGTFELTNFVNQTVPTTFCVGATLADVVIVGTQNLTWYDAATGSTVLPATTAMVTGSHYYATQTINGCESPSRYDLVPTINSNPTIVIAANPSNASVCSGGSISLTASGAATYSWSGGISNGVSFIPTASGAYTVIGTDANGCTSSASSSITVNSAVTSSQTLTLCAGQSITVGSNTYNTTGVYTDILTAANGCDSTVTTNLTVASAIDVTTNLSTNTITANASGATYQWIDCNNANAAIAGATNQSFTALANGSYAVVVTVGSCTDTSSCTAISSVGLKGLSLANAITVMPNPSKGVFTINLNTKATIQIVDMFGRVIMNEQKNASNFVVDLTNEANGVYTLRINNADFSKAIRLVKSN